MPVIAEKVHGAPVGVNVWSAAVDWRKLLCMKPSNLSLAIQPVLSRLDVMEEELGERLDALADRSHAGRQQPSSNAKWMWILLGSASVAIAVGQAIL